MAACTCADPTMVAMRVQEAGQSNAQELAKGNSIAEKINQTLYGSAGGGTDGAIGPLRFCHWRPPQISDVGENAWATAFRAAALAIAIANGVAQSEIASKQQDLAEGYYSMAKFKWDRFSQKYIPLEKKILNEVSTVPVREMDCVGAEDRAINAVTSAYNNLGNFLSRKARSLRLCIDSTLLSVVDHRQAVMVTDAMNYNLTDEQWYTDYKNDQRWNRRSNILNLGRNLASEALKYGDVARQLYGQVGAQIERAAGGVMQALGYYGARNDTYYPTTYLGSGTGQLVTVGSSVNANPVSAANPAAGG